MSSCSGDSELLPAGSQHCTSSPHPLRAGPELWGWPLPFKGLCFQGNLALEPSSVLEDPVT